MLTKDQQDAIAKAWRGRAEMQGYGKPTSAKYRKAEIDFLAGVASMLNVLYPNPEAGKLSNMVPPSWVMNPVFGRNVFPFEGK